MVFSKETRLVIKIFQILNTTPSTTIILPVGVTKKTIFIRRGQRSVARMEPITDYNIFYTIRFGIVIINTITATRT